MFWDTETFTYGTNRLRTRAEMLQQAWSAARTAANPPVGVAC